MIPVEHEDGEKLLHAYSLPATTPADQHHMLLSRNPSPNRIDSLGMINGRTAWGSTSMSYFSLSKGGIK